jgi:mono/diheme cytochrome c family protein
MNVSLISHTCGSGERVIRVRKRRFAFCVPSPLAVGRLFVGSVMTAIAYSAFTASAQCDEAPQLPPVAKRKVDFKLDIQPLFQKRCYECHGASKQEAGLRLDRRDDALNGGDSGPTFVSGKSSESRMVKYVAAVDPDVVMPPKGDRLSDEEIGLLRAWIDQGLNWPEQ